MVYRCGCLIQCRWLIDREMAVSYDTKLWVKVLCESDGDLSGEWNLKRPKRRLLEANTNDLVQLGLALSEVDTFDITHIERGEKGEELCYVIKNQQDRRERKTLVYLSRVNSFL